MLGIHKGQLARWYYWALVLKADDDPPLLARVASRRWLEVPGRSSTSPGVEMPGYHLCFAKVFSKRWQGAQAETPD